MRDEQPRAAREWIDARLRSQILDEGVHVQLTSKVGCLVSRAACDKYKPR